MVGISKVVDDFCPALMLLMHVLPKVNLVESINCIQEDMKNIKHGTSSSNNQIRDQLKALLDYLLMALEDQIEKELLKLKIKNVRLKRQLEELKG